jgi:DNA-binding response OmpR family regulator
VSKIVFCEDDPMIRKLVQTALRSTTHDVHIAEDGKEGLVLIERVRPDVVFGDVAMPPMDGFEMADAAPFTMAELRARVAQFAKN